MANDQRKAVRLDCDLPIRLEGTDGLVAAQMVDISRTGLRMRIPGAALRVHRLSSLAQISRNLTEILGEGFFGELHPELLGPLLRKGLITTRIAKRDWEQTDVEIGCSFAKPLEDEEVGMLGVPLPPVGDRRAVARGQAPLPQVREPSPRSPTASVETKNHTAFIYPAPGKTTQPLVTRTKSLSRGTALLEIEKMGGWEFDNLDVGQLVAALDDAYGHCILLRIVEDGHDLWAGPAEIKDVDVSPGSDGIRLGVSFGRHLRAEELDRLGVPAPA